jgi:hypothetical protein
MIKRVLFGLVLIVVGLQNASAGSAVATDDHGHLATSFGLPKDVAKRHVLDIVRKNGGGARILAATDISGFGAIAVGHHANGHGSIVSVALGRQSATEADMQALRNCIQAGAVHPKIISGFRG